MNADQLTALYQRIATVTTRYTFTHPVEIGDIEHVAREVRAVIGDCVLDIYHTIRHVTIQVRPRGKLGPPFYHREMIVSGAPYA